MTCLYLLSLGKSGWVLWRNPAELRAGSAALEKDKHTEKERKRERESDRHCGSYNLIIILFSQYQPLQACAV